MTYLPKDVDGELYMGSFNESDNICAKMPASSYDTLASTSNSAAAASTSAAVSTSSAASTSFEAST